MDPILIVLIVIASIVIIAGLFVVNVISALRNMRNAAGSQAIKMVGDLAEEILSGKEGNISDSLLSASSVRSVSDMTSVYAPQIARDFPDLNLKQLISSAENKLCSALYAVMEGSKTSTDSEGKTGRAALEDIAFSGSTESSDQFFLGATPDFASLILRQISALTDQDKTEYFDRVKIHKTGIYSYQKNAGTCEITLQSAVEYFHYIKQNGMVVSGSQQTAKQTRYNLYLIYVQDESRLSSSSTNAVGVSCPNCGAPVRGLGARKCEFCGSALQTIDMRIWRINQYTES